MSFNPDGRFAAIEHPSPSQWGERGWGEALSRPRVSAPARVAWTECPAALHSARCGKGVLVPLVFPDPLLPLGPAAWPGFHSHSSMNRTGFGAVRGPAFFSVTVLLSSWATWRKRGSHRFGVSAQSPELGTCGRPLDLFFPSSSFCWGFLL